MNSLFKYYSSNFDIIEHLIDPSIKLATTTSLNDPFEKELSEDLALNLTNKILEMDLYKDKSARKIKELKNGLITAYKNFSKNYGIVSLTETHRNLLMWAHYGSAHKGVCIGYRTDMFSTIETAEYETSKINLAPQRVKYDSKRFDSDMLYDGHKTIDILMQAIRTKSDEWMYEKEHRSIIPFQYADKIIVNKNNNKDLMSMITQYQREHYIIKDTKNKKDHCDIYQINKKESLNLQEYTTASVAHYDEVMVLKEISIKNISSIYLGSEYEFRKISGIINHLKSDPERYQHINLFKYEINKNDFALDIIPLNNKSLLSREQEGKLLIYQL